MNKIVLAFFLLILTSFAYGQPVAGFAGAMIYNMTKKKPSPGYGVFDEVSPDKLERSQINHRFDSIGKLLSRNPDNADLYYQRGKLRMQVGGYSSSKPDFDKAWELGNRQRPFLMDYGQVLTYLQQRANAITCFTAILKRDSTDAQAYIFRGIAKLFIRKGEFRTSTPGAGESIADFTKAIQFHPDYAEALTLRGLAYSIQDNFNAAITDLEMAIQQPKQIRMAYQLLGDAYITNKQPEEACKVFQKAAVQRFKIDVSSIRQSCGG